MPALVPAAVLVTLVAASLAFGQPVAGGTAVPELRIEAPDSLSREAARLETMNLGQLERLARLIRLTDAGPPIRVVLVPEGLAIAGQTPPWIAGFAQPPRDLIVLFPSRTGAYPHPSLEALLDHEVAHVLIARSAGGRLLPRWFDEGLASAAERPWALSDRSRFAWEVVTAGRVSLSELNLLFTRHHAAAARAYAVSTAFVQHLLTVHGDDLPGRILSEIAAGRSFDAAFTAATGDTAAAAADRFWNDYRLWERWVPLLTRRFSLWTLMTLLALFAIWTHRRKRAARRRRWDEEEQLERRSVF